MSKVLLRAAITGLALSAALVGTASGNAAQPAAASTLGASSRASANCLYFTQMATIAKQAAQSQFSDVRLLEGRPVIPQGWHASSAVWVPSWTFILSGRDQEGQATIFVTVSTMGTIDATQIVRSPFLGDMEVSLPIAMEPWQAELALRMAGYTSPYSTLVLRRPLSPPFPPNALFIFGVDTPQGRQFVSVDTVTYEVKPLT